MRKTLIFCAVCACSILSRWLYTFFLHFHRKIEKYDPYFDFGKRKYDREALYLMALSIPEYTPLHLSDVSMVYPELGKNHVYAIIRIRKEVLKKQPDFAKIFAIEIKQFLLDM